MAPRPCPASRRPEAARAGGARSLGCASTGRPSATGDGTRSAAKPASGVGPRGGASILVAAALLVLLTPAAHGALVPSGTGWIEVRAGLTFGDNILLDQSVSLPCEDAPGPAFAVGAHYRVSRYDLGLSVESLGSFGFAGLERTNRSGSQLRVAAKLRWRYVEEPWGALFIRLSPGFTAFAHSDELRVQAGRLRNASLAQTEARTFGFSLGFDFGMMMYLSQHIVLAAHVELLTANTTLNVRDDAVDYSVVRGIFAIGLEVRM